MTDDEEIGSSERAERDFHSKTRIHREVDKVIGGDGYTNENSSNVALGQNILREEIGYFGPYEGPFYSFDQKTRDVLLAHGRQDIAATFGMAQSAFRQATLARRVSERAVLYLFLSIVLNIAILAKLWWPFGLW